MSEGVIEFTCIDCGETKVKEPGAFDTGNLVPSRCVSCVLDRLADGGESA